MEHNEQSPDRIMRASVPQAVERHPWEQSGDEQRVLYFTFLGGLGAIVAGACVIGGAIAVARFLKANHYPLTGQILFIALTFVVVRAFRHPRKLFSDRSSLGRLVQVLLLVWGLASVLYLLSWVGWAAGAH